jgi:uncharacterized protein (TIGR03000 family)
MTRSAIAALLLVGVPITAVDGAGGGGGGGGGGGRGLAIGTLGLKFTPGRNPAGGLLPFNYHGSPGYPVAGNWGGFGGPSPLYMYGYNPATGKLNPRAIPTSRLQEPVTLSNQYPATLFVQLPTHGEVWANGKKGESAPLSEWTLTSPVLKPGEEFTFEVTARWESGGNQFEYKRTIAVQGGNQSRVTVVSGTPMSTSSGSESALKK